MSDKYIAMIQDFFQVFEALNQHVLDSHGELATWETQLVRLDINQGDKEKSYDVAQIAGMLNFSEDAVKSFLVIYSFLSNNLYDLIGNREYEDWGTDGDSYKLSTLILLLNHFMPIKLRHWWSEECTSSGHLMRYNGRMMKWWRLATVE